jgi:hypothetical protein
LTVVLFFLVDILGLILEPNTHGGRQLLWGKPQLSHTNNEGKQRLKNQNTKHRTKDNQKLFSQWLISQRSIPFTSAGPSPFIGRRADFYISENALV